MKQSTTPDSLPLLDKRTSYQTIAASPTNEEILHYALGEMKKILDLAKHLQAQNIETLHNYLVAHRSVEALPKIFASSEAYGEILEKAVRNSPEAFANFTVICGSRPFKAHNIYVNGVLTPPPSNNTSPQGSPKGSIARVLSSIAALRA